MIEPSSRTELRRVKLFQDRWTSFGSHAGIDAISEKLSVEEMRHFDIFKDYDDAFLERLSPDVSLAVWKEGVVLFEEGSYIDLAFFIANGEVDLYMQNAANLPIFDESRTLMVPFGDPSDPTATAQGTMLAQALDKQSKKQADRTEIAFLATLDFDLPKGHRARLGQGEIFGEIGALSGWPQSVTARTASGTELLQIRVPALRLMRRKSKALKERLDKVYRSRALATQLRSTPLLKHCPSLFIEALTEAVELVSFNPGEPIVEEGQPVDALYLVRSGFVRLAQRFAEGELNVSYLSKGMTLGEVELLVEGLHRWEVSAYSVEYAELVKMPLDIFRNFIDQDSEAEEVLWKSLTARLKEVGQSRRDVRHAELIQLSLDNGLVEGTSFLAIDLERCTRCDDCVRACAAVHDGRPRFVREGDKLANLLIARSCYHCRDPVCLVGCPTGAIHRAGASTVVEVDEELCIGCSTCANNCPYDAIMMHPTGETWPDNALPKGLRGRDRQVSSKCDLCHDTGHDPACVVNCPQGCAYRIGSLEELQELLR